jgi:hypothetical protein
MRNDLPLYEIFIDLNDPETKVGFNSLVKNPAHEREFQLFSEDRKQVYTFNDEEQIVVGEAIVAGKKIYRNSPTLGEHLVVFTKEAIKNITYQMSRDGFWNNLNFHHDGNDIVDDVAMIMVYQIDESKGMTAPEAFKDSPDGSLLVAYKLGKEAYERAKKEARGFSIEGVFIQESIDFQAILDALNKFEDLIKNK